MSNECSFLLSFSLFRMSMVTVAGVNVMIHIFKTWCLINSIHIGFQRAL